ncbi:tRNA (adenosine(37)-N6)-threonylcarbamoyltransferase complex dimerization subunit type 1 TsaB [Roseovarius sp. SCSIO 43702]|uniref:tRNA (adenosine(37)-N6)-threonylcarbamoyltransferase complex dimerization subunit type 1 TsaB n=1 Tax=Roseovarius sp. SCSIO 43702 TaxID=2823043 RepID=UPI001C73A703|nr:tRNA (adenosine(37)-N6)-threonylcarbamoyltransferase complex dimerization subunit type 1 TsaB [Roseovarius sp. SCSIO 43702]QYX57646.1 tRNA (adenosine(37)-N6)-threonylcarbamoyltransferase complex dimerization subunit type 1 TsaB [Roseovarius sp. SCSIO 43702]
MPSDGLVLGVDTSGPYCSAALIRGGDLLCETHQAMTRGQCEALFPLLEDLLSQAGAGWRDLALIGVGVGPGNFTGIRIAVSAARGLSLSLGVPAVGVTLLEAVALDTGGPVLAAVAAPQDRVYLQGFGTRADVPLTLMPVEEVPMSWAGEGLEVVGAEAARIAARLGVRHAPAVHAPGAAVARVAARRPPKEVTPPVPLYLRPADAAPPRDMPPVIVDD